MAKEKDSLLRKCYYTFIFNKTWNFIIILLFEGMQGSEFRLLNSITQEKRVFTFIYQGHRVPHRAPLPPSQEDDDCVTPFPSNDIDFIKLLKPNYENLLHQQHFIWAHEGPKKCKMVYFTWKSRKRDGCTPDVQMKETLEPSELGAEPHAHPRRKIHTSFLFWLRKEAQIPNTVFFTRHSSYTNPPRLLSFFSTERTTAFSKLS